MIHWEVPPTRRIAFSLVLAVMLASILVTVRVDFRSGGYTLAAALGLAAVLRAVLPERYCLGLLVRSRQMDVVVAGLLAVAVFVTTGIVPGA
jgi:Protein of unknown function (DUF3017)